MSDTTHFVRDRFTLLGYGTLAVFAMAMATLGPAMPLLRDDLGISRTVGGLHFTALAAGSVIAGLGSPRFVGRLGRPRSVAVGGTGVAIGSLLVAVGPHAVVTIAGALLFGTAGNVLLIVVQAAISDHHGMRRAAVLTEASALMSAIFLIPGLLIGALEGLGLSWRIVLVVPVVMWAVLAISIGRTVVPTDPDPRPADRPRFGPAFWALMPAVAIEWSIAGWAAGYLVDVGRLSEGAAASGAVVFYLAMAIGRFAGSRLARALPIAVMLPASVVVAAAGFGVFWAATTPAPILVGLVVAGSGVANLFPLLTAALLTDAPGMADRASSQVSLAGGIAVMIAPLTLGIWADRSGIRSAMAGVLVLLALLGATVVWWRAARPSG